MRLFELFSSTFVNGYQFLRNDQERLSVSTFNPSDSSVESEKIGPLPYMCTDVFAVTALALQLSGAYHYVAPASEGDFADEKILVSGPERDDWIEIGRKWRGDESDWDMVSPPEELLLKWEQFRSFFDVEVFRMLSEEDGLPEWWKVALELMCIADEAASGLGFNGSDGPYSLQARLISLAHGFVTKGNRAVFSFSAADPDSACILPKSRTPAMGCTLRSLTHNLALLPPRGIARALWVPQKPGDSSASYVADVNANSDGNGMMNCLLIPFPYKISAKAFDGRKDDDAAWGWFKLKPHWCPASGDISKQDEGFAYFSGFVKKLIREAEEDVGRVHVVVFPEAAMSHQIFENLVKALSDTHVELVIGGLFDHVESDKGQQTVTDGNYVAMSTIGESAATSVRQKHHRWRLDRGQILNYALGSSLDPNYLWWEDINILRRSLDFHVMRGTTTVTSLVCEDLARIDPCQELVRCIGPNLVFALLMDGPQIRARWPGRYATVLAEDPGCSVLSFTSLGLIERSNSTGFLPNSRSVGLWRDDTGHSEELILPTHAQALCMTLQSSDLEEYTLDGRGDRVTAESWRLSGLQPICLQLNDYENAIVNGKWPSH